jgi:hypothetical protein
MSLLRAVRPHLGITIPLFVLYAGAVILATRGTVDGPVVAVLALVLVLTLLTPAALSRVNRRSLRGSWEIATETGERVLHDGPADRYEAGFFGWLFLTDRRLVLCRLGGAEEWSAPLSQVAEVRPARYAGVFATDLLLHLEDGTTERLQVEANGEWVRVIRAALERLPAPR